MSYEVGNPGQRMGYSVGTGGATEDERARQVREQFAPARNMARERALTEDEARELRAEQDRCAAAMRGLRDAARGQVDMKFDSEKPRLALLPFDALEQVGAVLTFGAAKYAPNSWRTVPNALERYTSALLRHLAAMQRGEVTDAESGLPHAAHAACNALFIAALAPTKHGEETLEK